MALSPAQLATLKADIEVNANTIPAGRPFAGTAINTLPNNVDADFEIARWYGLFTAAFIVWRTNVTITMVGDNFVGSELSGLTTANQTRLQTIAQFSPSGINPSLEDRRFFFDDVFSGAGGAATRAKLLILWKRLARNIEKVFATGTGLDASPATMVFEGTITSQDVENARNLP